METELYAVTQAWPDWGECLHVVTQEAKCVDTASREHRIYCSVLLGQAVKGGEQEWSAALGEGPSCAV